MTAEKRYEAAQLDQITPLKCPCGWARRAFASATDSPLSVHRVEILEDARTHYHKGFTETYIVIEGGGYLELDGEKVPVQPWSTIQIKPGCRHRAVGKMTIINIATPRFDPEDEWFD